MMKLAPPEDRSVTDHILTTFLNKKVVVVVFHDLPTPAFSAVE